MNPNTRIDLACRMYKAESHAHLEGTLEPDLAFVLARRRWPAVNRPGSSH